MATIVILDDWGKEQHRLDIVSADANDLRESVTAGLNDYEVCLGCNKYVSNSDAVLIDREDMGYLCKACERAERD